MGTALRLLWPGDFLFRLDEAVHVEWAARIAGQPAWITHAWASSVGVPNGPVFVYWLVPFAMVSPDPLVANLSIVLANVLALICAVPLFRRLLPEPGDAEMAIALFATSPVGIWYSRKIWDPCVLALFLVPALLLALRALQGRRSPAVAGVLVLLALAAQAHQSAVFFGVVLAGVLATAWRRLSPFWVAAGAVGAAAVLAPYLSHVLPLILSGDLARKGGSAWPDIDVVTNLLLDASGHNILQAAGREGGRLLLWPLPPLGLLVQLAAIPFYVYVLAGYAEVFRPRGPLAPGARRLLLGTGVGLPALYLVLRVQGVAHYFLAILPVLFALIVLGRRRLGTRRPRWVFPLPVLVGVNVLSWVLFQSYMSWNRGSEDYGLPYARVAEVSREVARRAEALGKGTPEEPLRLLVDVPRDRGPLPEQYRYVLERMLGVRVLPPEEGAPPDLTVRIRWPRPRGGRPWSFVDAPGDGGG